MTDAAPGDLDAVQLAIPDEVRRIPRAAQQYPLEIGAGQAISRRRRGDHGARAPGESAEKPVRWPDDFPDEAQRSKTKPVRVNLLDVKRKSLPALDDAFAREVGDFESLDALTATVRKDLEETATRESDAAVRQQLIDQIAGANPFDVPPSWVNQVVDGYLKAYQVPEEEHERFRTEFRPVAERQVRRDLIVESVAESEKLAATESDIDDRVADVASKRGAVDPGQVYASLTKAGRLKEIEQSITEEKVTQVANRVGTKSSLGNRHRRVTPEMPLATNRTRPWTTPMFRQTFNTYLRRPK